MKQLRAIDLINALERSESGAEFGAIAPDSVPGFDRLAQLFTDRGEPFTADGVRVLVRAVAAKRGEPTAKILLWRLELLADCGERLNARPVHAVA